MSGDIYDNDFFPVQDWLKVGAGEKTGFYADFPIPGTHITRKYDVGDTFWNLSDEEKDMKARQDTLAELGSLQSFAGTAETRAFYEAASREYLVEQVIGLTAALEESRQEVASLRDEPQTMPDQEALAAVIRTGITMGRPAFAIAGEVLSALSRPK